MQICTSAQTDNHANIPPLSIYRPDAIPATQPTASKHWKLLSLLHFFSLDSLFYHFLLQMLFSLSEQCKATWPTFLHWNISFQQQQHSFNGFLSGITWVSRYQKGKTSLDLLEQETVSGSGISWALYRPAAHPRQITMPAPHHWNIS